VIKRARSRVTIKDIARECGVAPSTVSNALAGKSYVKPETRLAIENAAARQGYRASTIARALRTKRSFSVGVLLADIANPTFPEIVRGIEDALRESGCTLLLCNTDGSELRQAQYLRALQDRQVDGLILVSQHLETPEIQALLAHAPPTVLVHRRDRSRPKDYVGLDNAGGIEMALEHLRTLGHHRIAFMRGPAVSTAVAERVDAFHRYLRRHQLDPDPRLIVQADYSRDGGFTAGERLFALSERPTAVIASNDVAALGLMEAASRHGIRIPHDLSTIGFDDIFVAALDSIALTTIQQPKHEIGAAAAKLLLKRITSGKLNYRPKEVIFPAHLIIRGTTAPPAQRDSQRTAEYRPRAPKKVA
jgi:LacI family transcriptional regulator